MSGVNNIAAVSLTLDTQPSLLLHTASPTDSKNLLPLLQQPKSPSQPQKKPKPSWPIHLLSSSKPPQLLPSPKRKLRRRKKNPKKSPTLTWDLTCLVKKLSKIITKCNIIPSFMCNF